MNDGSYIRDLKATRGEYWGFLTNFLCNFSRSARLMHAVLHRFQDQKDLFSESMRNYVIAMASCLETFYRDLYVYVLSQDEVALRNVLPSVRDKATYSEIHAIISEGISFSEIAASKVRFQNLSDIETFMSLLFPPPGYLETLGQFNLECIVPARRAKAQMRLGDGWRPDFASIFEKRHSFVHDANNPCLLNGKEMQRIETAAILVPQITAELVSQKYDGKGTIRIGNVPVLLIVEDLIADEWEVADTGGISIKK